MTNDLKQGLVSRLKQVGAYDVRIADPHAGYEHAIEGRRPLDLWKQCRAVVVFAVASSPKTNNIYAGPYAPWPEKNREVGPTPQYIQSYEYAVDRLARVFISSIALRGMKFLEANGCNTSVEYSGISTLQLKLSAFEAGLGVYGRSGVIIHPLIGNRIRLGAILTDAVLEPDGRLEGFEPCENCDLCIKICPAKAFDPTKSYPHSYSREKCTPKRAEIENKKLYCHNCWAVCPAGTLKDEELLCIEEARSFFKPHRE